MAATSTIPAINPAVTATVNSATAKSATPGVDKNTLAGNFQTFLTLLTTQLKNQNPLDPLDTNQFTQQLVQFAQVEQQLKQNEQLATLVSLEKTAQSTMALGFVGASVAVDGQTAALTEGKAHWTFSVPKPAQANVTIKSATGQTVYAGNFGMNTAELRLGRPRRQRRAMAGRQLHPVGGGQGCQRPAGGGGHRNRGRGRQRRSHPSSAAAFDRRPDLHHRQDQAGGAPARLANLAPRSVRASRTARSSADTSNGLRKIVNRVFAEFATSL